MILPFRGETERGEKGQSYWPRGRWRGLVDDHVSNPEASEGEPLAQFPDARAGC